MVDKVELPQLFTTFTTGFEGVVLGAATPVPGRLLQPLTVALTVYVPALLTVIDAVVALLLHNNVPDAVVDKVDVPLQLFTTVTTGVDGIAFGAAVPLPAILLHPLLVAVTVYVPAVATVIDEVVAPVLHNNVPVAVVESVELPQLFTMVTTGVDGIAFGAATPLPVKLVQPFIFEVTV